jgi:peroxiredoxin
MLIAHIVSPLAPRASAIDTAAPRQQLRRGSEQGMKMNIVVRGLVAAAALSISAAAIAGKPAKVGEAAPPFTLLTYDKHKLSLDDLRGKVVVINHWATWCGPCKAEMPMMSGFHHRFKDKGFEIFGVTTEDSVPAGQLKRLSEVLSYPLVRHFSGNYPILTGVPTSYVIDRKGVVRYAKATAFSERDFVELIIPLLNEPVPAAAAQTAAK